MPNADGRWRMTFHACCTEGGVFIMYTAIKEIAHMITLEDKEDEVNQIHSPHRWQRLSDGWC